MLSYIIKYIVSLFDNNIIKQEEDLNIEDNNSDYNNDTNDANDTTEDLEYIVIHDSWL